MDDLEIGNRSMWSGASDDLMRSGAAGRTLDTQNAIALNFEFSCSTLPIQRGSTLARPSRPSPLDRVDCSDSACVVGWPFAAAPEGARRADRERPRGGATTNRRLPHFSAWLGVHRSEFRSREPPVADCAKILRFDFWLLGSGPPLDMGFIARFRAALRDALDTPSGARQKKYAGTPKKKFLTS